MPTYDYVCEACGHRFEHFQSMNSRRLRKCPECTQRKLVRLIGSGAGVIFKGSGFYETDYKRAGRGEPSSGDGPADEKPAETGTADTGSSDSGSSDTGSSDTGRGGSGGGSSTSGGNGED